MHPIRIYPHATYCADRADPCSWLAWYIIMKFLLNYWHMKFDIAIRFLKTWYGGIRNHAFLPLKRCFLTKKKMHFDTAEKSNTLSTMPQRQLTQVHVLARRIRAD